jgi:Holliday junction DNA helicase RuvB
MVERLDFYKEAEIKKIIRRSAKILDIEIDDLGADEISRRSRKTPRIANRLLKRVRDFAEVKGEGKIEGEVAQKALERLHVDECGLDATDRNILETIINKFNGGPVGLSTLAAATAEECDTIEDVYEPYLIQLGYLERTPKGRKVTPAAYLHLKIKDNSNQKKLL